MNRQLPVPAPGDDAASTRRPARARLWTWPGPLLLALALTACQPAVLDPQGPVAGAERMILFDSLAIMLAIVGPTILATVGFAWWFRGSNPRARYLPDWGYSGRIELVTWGVPLLTIMLLGGVAWVGSHELDPARPIESKELPLQVQVVSLDWKWLFILPDQQVASVNELTVPFGRAVHFSLTSASVMNAFFVPQLGSMIYTMNGMTTQLYLQADHAGTYRGISSHYSGDGFSDMHFALRATDAAGFAAWVDAARKDGPALDDAGYAELAKQSTKVVPYTFRIVEAGLFQRVVDQTLPPGPGPRSTGGGQSKQAALTGGAGASQVAPLKVGTRITEER